MNPAPTPGIRYRIAPADPHAHLFEVSLEIDNPDPVGQRVSMPAWIPGSYMIREFARHVVSIGARQGRREVALHKIDKHTWQAEPVSGVSAPRVPGVCLGSVGAGGPSRWQPWFFQCEQRVCACNGSRG